MQDKTKKKIKILYYDEGWESAKSYGSFKYLAYPFIVIKNKVGNSCQKRSKGDQAT